MTKRLTNLERKTFFKYDFHPFKYTYEKTVIENPNSNIYLFTSGSSYFIESNNNFNFKNQFAFNSPLSINISDTSNSNQFSDTKQQLFDHSIKKTNRNISDLKNTPINVKSVEFDDQIPKYSRFYFEIKKSNDKKLNVFNYFS